MRLSISNVLAGMLMITIACTGPKKLTTGSPEFSKSLVSVEEVLAKIPDYSGQLIAAKGNGRAIVSEPGTSERVSIEFSSNRELSLITIKNRLGIEGGAMLVDADSILMYFKVDKIAQKVSVNDGHLTSINELASVNLLDLLNFTLDVKSVLEVYESDEYYLLRLNTDGGATVNKVRGFITNVKHPPNSGLPYSEIRYENYGQLENYTLPRKITIFSADGLSKVVFQIRTLQVNPDDLVLKLAIPDDIPIQRL
jgi:hypothetical protein